jgi:pyruvate,orthophosphate dikinase
MTSIGIDVPPGFTLTTNLCDVYDKYGDLPSELWDATKQAIKRVESDMGRKYGDKENPLLFSCRSGAAVSMPGMMDTVLNIGLNSETVEGLAKTTGNARFAWDAFRRLLDMYGQVVLEIPHHAFEDRLKAIKAEAGVADDVDLNVKQLQKLTEEYKKVYTEHNVIFPEDPYEQLFSCVKAVFGSWNSERAIKYREINNIHTLIGTAANIQTMVFGNMGDNSGTGVAFSRDPGTGENKLYGEYLINAQGEDVVAGIRTPEPISRMQQVLPDAYRQFIHNVEKLETNFKDMQDIEFTVENGKLWMLQCRSGKRTGPAALRIAIDMVNEGLCTSEEALLKIETDHIKQLLHPAFTPEALASSTYKDNVVATGLAGGPGAAVGKIVFDAKTAEERKADGENVILVRENTSPEDVGGMWAAEGVLTARGGMTSHAAVVARGWGKPCVCGCGELEIDEEAKTATIKSTGEVFKEGDVISLNGNTGEVIRIGIETSTPSLEGDMGTVLEWADKVADSCTVMANADSGPDAAKASELGARGIGLCRTEHMFFSPERLPVVRRWILRGEGLDKVQEFQRSDFREILHEMDAKPVTIRLLDPPLHEFLFPASQADEAMAIQLGFGTDVKGLKDKVESLHEENPMLGLRGCRLAIIRPELTTMQVEAILHASADLMEANPEAQPRPRIMIPLVGSVAEFENQALKIKQVASRVQQERGLTIRYEIGTMMEVPRATLIADQIASLVDEDDGERLCSFFSYGTNDLTQMTMGISRDDSGAFIPKYIAQGIYENDPFRTIDTEGVGYLIKKSAADGRLVNPSLSLSVCGEHGGDPTSIDFFDSVGLNYVSCSPFRVPVARLAAGQAAVRRISSSPPGAPTAEERVSTFTSYENCAP